MLQHLSHIVERCRCQLFALVESFGAGSCPTKLRSISRVSGRLLPRATVMSGQSCATRILRAAIQHRSWKPIHMYPDVTPRHCRWSLVAAKRPMHLNGTTALWPALHIKSESRTLSITSKVYLFKLVWSSDLVYVPWIPSTSTSTWAIVPLPALSAVHGIWFLSLVCPCLSNLDLLATEFLDIKCCQTMDSSVHRQVTSTDPLLLFCLSCTAWWI